MEPRFSSTYPLSLTPDSNGGDSNAGMVVGGRPEMHDGAAESSNSAAMPNVVVFGCSGHARVVIDILETERRCRIVGLVDSYKPVETRLLDYQILGTEADVAELIHAHVCDALVVAVGDNWIRGQIVNQLKESVPGLRFISAIHPSAQISKNALIGAGTVIMPGVVVNAGSRIGESCILNTCSSLDHDCTMADFASLAPRAVTGGNVSIGAYTAVAIGATVSHGTQIGDHTVVGAGALVVSDIPAGVVAYGVPARVIRTRNPDDPYLGERSYERLKSGPAGKYVRVSGRQMPVRLIPADSPEWDGIVGRTAHDFFHTSRYHRLTEAFHGGKAWLAVCGNDEKFIAWAMIRQGLGVLNLTNANGFSDLSSVYGYTGPIAYKSENDHVFLRAAWDAMKELWRSRHAVSAFTRFHPLLENHKYVPYLRDERNHSEFVHDGYEEGATVAIDLTQSPEAVRQCYSRHLDQALRRQIRQGITVSPDPEWAYLDDFSRMYYSTMKRNKANEFYFFSHAYFARLKEALGPHGTLMIARCRNEIAAASLLIEYRGMVHLHLLATDDNFLPLSPSKLIIHEAQVWARARGNRLFHLGGGRGSRTDDPLFRFKSRFSNKSYPFYTGRWVLNGKVYEALTAQRSQQVAHAPATDAAEPFFPAYRAPI